MYQFTFINDVRTYNFIGVGALNIAMVYTQDKNPEIPSESFRLDGYDEPLREIDSHLKLTKFPRCKNSFYKVVRINNTSQLICIINKYKSTDSRSPDNYLNL